MSLFEQILREGLVQTLYQPIINLKNGELIGYEALSRGPQNTDLASPLALIAEAHSCNRLAELEMLFRQKALENSSLLGAGQRLFLNVDPDIIKAPNFQAGLTHESLNKLNISMSAIVFEITERTAIHDYEAFVSVLDHYRQQGYSIAIDDVGAGYAGLRSMLEIRPSYIKLDMDLIRNIHIDNLRQSLIKAMVDALSGTDTIIIAEGIESEDELKTLSMLGVDAGQGYFIGLPNATMQLPAHNIIEKITNYARLSSNFSDYSQDYHYISNLIDKNEDGLCFDIHDSCSLAREHMKQNSLRSLVVTQHRFPVGLLTEAALDAKLSGPYGFSLYVNRSLKYVMKSKPLIVDAYTPIHIVARKAMERNEDELFDDVIVCQSNQVLGLVQMKRIIEYTLSYEKHAAKELNPLSGLPGNTIINRVLSDVLEYVQDICVFYVDINDFKIYNDVYGFERGDQMILAVSELLRKVVKQRYAYGSFIGHIGGDDFIVLVEGDYARAMDVAYAISNGFNQLCKNFYDEEHLKSGLVKCEDRYGIEREFPLTSLAVAGIQGGFTVFENVVALSETLGMLKKKAKKIRFPYIHVEKIEPHYKTIAEV